MVQAMGLRIVMGPPAQGVQTFLAQASRRTQPMSPKLTSLSANLNQLAVLFQLQNCQAFPKQRSQPMPVRRMKLFGLREKFGSILQLPNKYIQVRMHRSRALSSCNVDGNKVASGSTNCLSKLHRMRSKRFIRTRVHGPEKACACRGQAYMEKPTQLRQARRRLWHTTWSSCSASTSLTVQKMHAAQVSCVQSNGCAQGKWTKRQRTVARKFVPL